MITFHWVQWTDTFERSREDILATSTNTLLYFYPKDNTPWCTVEAVDFTRLSDDFAALDIQIVWVSKDSLKSHCSFVEKHRLQAIYLSDPDLALHKKYGARGEKKMYGKVSQWVIRSTFLLDAKGNIQKERRNVRAKGHAERVLKELEGVGK